MKNLRLVSILAVALMILMSQGGRAHAEPLGTAFTYTGVLFEQDVPANGQYDFSFGLFDMDVNGVQLGDDVNVPYVNVSVGFFTVLLDFGGDVFNGDARWLEIGVRQSAQETLDQQQISLPSVTVGVLDAWQSFTPGISGFLTKVEIRVYASTSGLLGTLRIYEGEGTSGALLTTESITLTEVDDFKTFTLSRPPLLASDSKYTLRITVPDDPTKWFNVFSSFDNPYPGGRSGFDPNEDLNFETYMVSDQGEYTTLIPRREITPTPYAIYAVGSGSDNDWMVSGNDMYSIPSGNVGVGTTAPKTQLNITKTLTIGANSNYEAPAGGGSNLELRYRTDGDADTAEIISIDRNTGRKPLRIDADPIALMIGNVGVGTTSPAAAAKLDIIGKIKITDGTQGEGRVLTSDASGLASWQSLAFGNRSSRENNTTYLATTDGFVVGNTSNLDDGDVCEILSGPSSPPTTVVTHIFSAGSITGGNMYPFCIPIKKGDYWRVEDDGSYGSARIWWIPIGG